MACVVGTEALCGYRGPFWGAVSTVSAARPRWSSWRDHCCALRAAQAGGDAGPAGGDTPSPCVRICRYKRDFLDGHVCIGCFRDAHEIASWSRLSGGQNSPLQAAGPRELEDATDWFWAVSRLACPLPPPDQERQWALADADDRHKVLCCRFSLCCQSPGCLSAQGTDTHVSCAGASRPPTPTKTHYYCYTPLVG